MKREIKFRGWNTKDSIMYSAEELGLDQLQIHPNGMGFFNAHPNSTRMSTFFNHITPLQFTGLKDKNGKEIYEGDICHDITLNDGRRMLWIVEWNSYYYTLRNVLSRVSKSSLVPNYMWEKMTVVGNIYENPELLKD